MLCKSKITKRPLFLIKKYNKKKNIKSREDLTDANKFLQVSFLNLKKQQNVEPHAH